MVQGLKFMKEKLVEEIKEISKCKNRYRGKKTLILEETESIIFMRIGF
ncbi:MAG: hypothetical protein ABIB46_02750 [bacterium]